MYGRFLVSFSEKYLADDFCISSCHKIEGDSSSLDHQLLKVNVPQTNADLFGPAFIEVRNKWSIIIYSIFASIIYIIGNFSIIFPLKMLWPYNKLWWQLKQGNRNCIILPILCYWCSFNSNFFVG